MTSAQLTTLRNDITNTPAFMAKPHSADGAFEIAAAYNLDAAPAFWVWRTAVSRADIYNTTSPDATSWDWTIYKGQGVAEQNAWVQMFMGDAADFSQANLRAGIGKIFGAVNANTTHCLAIGRRQATRGEKLFATGTGSTGSPAVLSIEGALDYHDILVAMNW